MSELEILFGVYSEGLVTTGFGVAHPVLLHLTIPAQQSRPRPFGLNRCSGALDHSALA